MKKVFTDNNTIAHMWANSQQDEARNPSYNFYYRGDTIFSYGRHFPIATKYGNTVFITTQGYSNTTAKHIRAVKSAIWQNTIETHNPHGIALYNERFWEELDHFARVILTYVDESQRPRIRQTTIVRYKQLAEKERLNAITFLNFWGLSSDNLKNKRATQTHKRKKDGTYYTKHGFKAGGVDREEFGRIYNLLNTDHLNGVASETVNAVRELLQRKAKRQEAERVKRYKKAKQQAEENLKEWLRGENVSTYQFNNYIEGTYLRAKDGCIQTSKGAQVEYESGKLLYNAMHLGEKIVGRDIDGYTVMENTPEHVKIGCHILSKQVIEQFAKTQKW